LDVAGPGLNFRNSDTVWNRESVARLPVGQWKPDPEAGVLMSRSVEIDGGAETYRTKARALRRQANAISDAQARTGILFTALYYEALADQMERTEAGPPADGAEAPEADRRPWAD